MDSSLDIDEVRDIIEQSAARTEELIDSYVGRKEQLIALLQELQAEYNYLPKDVLAKVSEKLELPLSQVFSVATFFQAFSLKPRGRHTVMVCMGTACHVKGGQRLVDKMSRDYGMKPGETTDDERFTLETVNCLGACALGPVVVVDGKYESQVNPDKLDKILARYE